MKYLSKILNLNWLERSDKSKTVEAPSEDPRGNRHKFSIPYDVSVAHFEDEGGMYLIAFDGWSSEDIENFADSFGREWEKKIDNTAFCVISGRIGKDDDIEIVHTSLDEIFEHEKDG